MSPQPSRKSKGWFLFRISLIAFLFQNVSVMVHRSTSWVESYQQREGRMMSLVGYSSSHMRTTKSHVAIISGFVSKDKNETKNGQQFMDQILNKVCYSHLQKYDFIFNTTWGFADHERGIGDDPAEGRFWLDYDTWHRVPHIIAAMERGYEWVFYADVDYTIQDLTTSLESFVKERELHAQEDVHVFVLDDEQPGRGSYAIMIRNSNFGRKLLQNWKIFGLGLCRNGNFRGEPDQRDWGHGDQPGLWYALARTHAEMNPPLEYTGAKCNETTGYLQTQGALREELNEYMSLAGLIRNEESVAFHSNQSISSSNTRDDNRSGLGFQQLFDSTSAGLKDSRTFAIHKTKDLPPNVLKDIQGCKQHHRCVANEADGKFEIHCGYGSSWTGIMTDHKGPAGFDDYSTRRYGYDAIMTA